jgi:hypothetical protein
MSMPDFAFDTGTDDTASQDAMTGPASAANQASAKGAGRGTPTRSLIMLFFAALLLYWGLAYLFRRQLS